MGKSSPKLDSEVDVASAVAKSTISGNNKGAKQWQIDVRERKKKEAAIISECLRNDKTLPSNGPNNSSLLGGSGASTFPLKDPYHKWLRSRTLQPKRDFSRTVFVRGFGCSLSEDEIKSLLMDHFGSCGQITSITVVTDCETHCVTGLVFVAFSTVEGYTKALELNGKECRMERRRLLVGKARPSVPRPLIWW